MNAKKTEKTAQIQTGNGAAQEPQHLPDMSKHNIVPLKDGEKAVSRTVVSVDQDRVDCWYSLGTNKDVNVPHQGYTVFDFSGCSKAELLDLASRSPLIAVQRRWSTIARSSGVKEASKPGQFARIDVKTDIVDAARQSAPPSAKAGKLIDKMSADEKAALLEKLQAELNGS